MRKARPHLQQISRLAYRVRHRLERELAHGLEQLRLLHAPTHRELGQPLALQARFQFLDADFLAFVQTQEPRLPGLVLTQADASMRHEFDLLGSGPTVNKHGIRCKGVAGVVYPASKPVEADTAGRWLEGRVNRTNLKASQRLWQLIGPGYVPIDWQLDFKSGYRWKETSWHRNIRFSHLPGVDVKVPWELARLQHLPTLALAAHFARTGASGFHDTTMYAQEFRHQVLDFMATNPPGFGVNWSCTMDVAIRCTNLLVARDILVAAGTRLDDAFESAFAANVLAHGRHIVRNLEWSPVYRGNHYMANVVGLLFVATYLPASTETDGWLAFSVQELMAEVGYQFHEDGSNFEASVCYHRLSAEMVMWGFALLAQLPEDRRAVLTHPQLQVTGKLPRWVASSLSMHPVPGGDGVSPVPPWCWERLGRMADFTQAMTRPDGTVVQFGDNDSGRFITLGSGEQLRAGTRGPDSPAWSLDHGALIAGIHALLGVSGETAGLDEPGALVVRAFAGLAPIPPNADTRPAPEPHKADIGDEKTWDDVVQRLECAAEKSRWSSEYPAGSVDLRNGLVRLAHAGMGCYVFRGNHLFLAVRCGEIGIAGLGAHAHCDQLGIELMLEGKSLVRDPGTYLYTPSPDQRNAYRKAGAHHVPHVSGQEPADLSLGLFDLRGAAEGECLYFGPRGFIGRHKGYGAWVYRIVEVESGRITVRDFAEQGLALAASTPEPLPFSPAYGRLLR